MSDSMFVLETIAADRIAERRRAAARRELLRAAGTPRPLRQRVGTWLIRTGEWLAPGVHDRPSHAH